MISVKRVIDCVNFRISEQSHPQFISGVYVQSTTMFTTPHTESHQKVTTGKYMYIMRVVLNRKSLIRLQMVLRITHLRAGDLHEDDGVFVTLDVHFGIRVFL